MASAPSKTTTVKTVNNKTGVTKSTSTTTSGGSTTVTKTTTIGAPKTTSSSSSVSTPSKAAAAVLGERWIAGPNDAGWVMCGPVAVANDLLATLGVEASNAAIERLYRDAGGIGDSGVPVPSVLAAATCTGLAGYRLADWRVAHPSDADVLLLTIPGADGLHAAAVRDGQLITWGDEIPLVSLGVTIHNAWSLTWHGEVR